MCVCLTGILLSNIERLCFSGMAQKLSLLIDQELLSHCL